MTAMSIMPVGCPSPAADATDGLRWHVEECRESLDPLVHELSPVHEDQRVDAALAINQAATTVLPNAVVAANTPVSCASIARAAAACSGRSSP